MSRSVRSLMYQGLRLSNDARAIRKGRAGRRVTRRVLGRMSGRWIGRLTR